jgi:dimeric dUTPase (all-alpha-NTP-PPase superfamily)
MDLKKLFETQKILRDRINYNEPDRFNKLVLALLVELGECANEWRGFKFWSKDQEPRTKSWRKLPDGSYDVKYNPLLEEYVDGLHFVLELGIELDCKPNYVRPFLYENTLKQFNGLYWEISVMETEDEFEWLFRKYLGLGEMLGFTWKEIESAYYAKNQINHQRQENGY